MRRLLLIPIDIYRRRISGMKGSPCCRFSPSCSNYAYRAIDEWGCVIGLILSSLRLIRCNPLFKGGEDPVPRRKRKIIPKTRTVGKRCLKKNVKNYFPYLISMERYL